MHSSAPNRESDGGIPANSSNSSPFGTIALDEWGYKPLDRKNPTTVYDIHASILHLLGIDHTKLTFRNNGIDRRLTDVHGHVIYGLLA